MRHALAAVLLAGASAAAGLELEAPVDCTAAGGCYIQNYVDGDPGPGAQDFTCGPQTYDGHKGVDLRVATFAALNRGVTILAAAPGRVRAVRDGEPDTGSENYTEGRDCGNGLAIVHGDGSETQYCHMAKGSLLVSPGDTVAAGQPLGRMGYSGRTTFPHLHLTLRRDGQVVDPFNPGASRCVATDPPGLWSEAARRTVRYAPGGVVDVGLASEAPELAKIRHGGVYTADALDRNASALVVWGRFHGLRTGDSLTVTLQDPSGATIVDHTVTMDRNRAEQFIYAGAKRTGGWPGGLYLYRAALSRAGRVDLRKDGAIRF